MSITLRCSGCGTFVGAGEAGRFVVTGHAVWTAEGHLFFCHDCGDPTKICFWCGTPIAFNEEAYDDDPGSDEAWMHVDPADCADD